MWVQANCCITFKGDSDWRFYYTVEGVNNKNWILFFFNPSFRRVYLRSPYLDIKLSGVVVQKLCFFSNVYSLMVERADPLSPISVWTTDVGETKWAGHQPSAVLSLSGGGGTPPPTKRETYFCSPAIKTRDAFRKLKMDNNKKRATTTTLHYCEDDNSNFINKKVISGYVFRLHTAGGKTHHRQHFRSWIPWITVDSDTFGCRFKLVCNASRPRDECLECTSLPMHRSSMSPAMSNFMMNH